MTPHLRYRVLACLIGALTARSQSPTAVPNLRLWLDAADPSAFITNAAGRISQWSDKSGFGTHATQTDANRQPLAQAGALNGRRAVRFDGATASDSTDPNDDGLFVSGEANRADVAAFSLARPYTVFIVDQYWDNAVRGRTLQSQDTNWLLGKWGGNHAHFTGAFVGPGRPASAGQPALSTGVGGLYDSMHFLHTTANGRVGNLNSPGRMALGTPTLFNQANGYREPSRADVGEVVAYTRTLADDEQVLVERYLSNKWALPRPWGRHFATRTVRFTGGDAGEGLDFQGIFHAAVNVGGPGGAQIGQAVFSDDVGGDPRVSVTAQNHLPSWATPSFGVSSDDAGLNQICTSIRWHNGVNWGTAEPAAATTAVVQDLIPGHAYKLQVITFEQCCPTRHYGLEVNGELVKRNFNGASIQGAPNAGAGAALVHSFVATNSTLVVRMRSADVNGGDKNPILSAFTLEDMGSPGTGAASVITGPESLDLSGTFLHALNFAGSGTQSVGGVVFNPAETAPGAFTYAENSFPSYHRPEFGASADQDALETVLASIRWEQADQEEQVVASDLEGLTPGHAYRLQLLFSDAPNSNRRFDIVINQVVVAPMFHPAGLPAGNPNQAALYTYDFVAASTNLNIVLDGRTLIGRAGFDPNPILSGLTLESLGPLPVITRQPVGGLFYPDTPASVSVEAVGVGPLTYQWRLNGAPVAGATNATYAVSAFAPALAGDYTVVVTNPNASVTSGVARLDLVVLPPVAVSGLRINEFLASNDDGLDDEDGDSPDWIEIHNENPFPVNLAGWRLTDNAGNLAKWVFPNQVLGSNAYLVVFASGKDRRVPGLTLHTNFKLEASGEYLALVHTNGVAAQAFSPMFPPQKQNVSYGRAIRVQVAPLFDAASAPIARWLVPSDGSLGATWRGGAEPFDDSGWTPGRLPIGYDATAAYVEPPVETVGHSLILRGTIDGANGGAFVQNTAAFAASAVVTRWSYYGGIAGRQITPLIFVETNGTFQITGVGATRASAVGLQNHPFGLVAGSAQVGPAHFVGWKDGAQGVNNQGVISWNTSNGGAIRYFNTRTNFAPGDNYGAGTHYDREYSVQFSSQRTLSSHLATDVQAAMKDVRATLYVRIPFTLAAPPVANGMRLRVRHEDGFAAWLNGVLIASRNAPADPDHTSAATADRTPGEGLVEEVLDVGAHLPLLASGANVLALQGLNESVGGAEFLLDAVLETTQTTIHTNRYLSPPTPGQPNGDGYVGWVADTQYSPRRGLYSTPQTVTITSATAGAAIYYTLDGSEPGPANGTLYAGPIAVGGTTMLRARALLSDHLPTNVDTHTYLFPAQVQNQPAAPPGLPASWAGIAADYAMDPNVVSTTLPGYSVPEALAALPSLSLVMPRDDWWSASSGIYYNSSATGTAWERKVSMEYIPPGGTGHWHTVCGVEISGNSSRNHGFTPKHSLRLSFRNRYGPEELKQNLFPDTAVDEFDQLTLRACSTDSWPVTQGNVDQGVQRWNNTRGTYLRDQWARDALRDIGQPGAHGRYFHVYINGLYWGVYNLAERLNSGWNGNHFGGKKDEYDVVKDFGELESGNLTAWYQLMAAADAGFPTEAAYQAVQGNHPDGTRNPNLPVLLDVDNLIDYMIVHIYIGAEDWATHNWWGSRRRGPLSQGWRFYAWDQEISNDSLVRARVGSHVGGDLFELVDDRNAGNPGYVYSKLRAHPSFQQRFRDRVQRLLLDASAPLAPAANAARWMVRQNEIDLAIVAESARWGDYRHNPAAKRETNWLSEMNWSADTYWPQIHPIAVARFQNAGLLPALAPPAFSQPGGVFTPPFSLSISHANPAGVVYYTLDGRDPRAVDANPAAFASAYAEPIPFTNGVHRVVARVRNGTEWSAATSQVFTPYDMDLDGMADAWELAHGLQVGVNDASLDPDADGHHNLQEFLAGTDPLDALNVLRVVDVVDLGPQLRVRFPTVSGRVYHVETATDLAGWSTAQTITGDGSVRTVDIPIAPADQRVYARVRTGL